MSGGSPLSQQEITAHPEEPVVLINITGEQANPQMSSVGTGGPPSHPDTGGDTQTGNEAENEEDFDPRKHVRMDMTLFSIPEESSIGRRGVGEDQRLEARLPRGAANAPPAAEGISQSMDVPPAHSSVSEDDTSVSVSSFESAAGHSPQQAVEPPAQPRVHFWSPRRWHFPDPFRTRTPLRPDFEQPGWYYSFRTSILSLFTFLFLIPSFVLAYSRVQGVPDTVVVLMSCIMIARLDYWLRYATDQVSYYMHPSWAKLANMASLIVTQITIACTIQQYCKTNVSRLLLFGSILYNLLLQLGTTSLVAGFRWSEMSMSRTRPMKDSHFLWLIVASMYIPRALYEDAIDGEDHLAALNRVTSLSHVFAILMLLCSAAYIFDKLVIHSEGSDGGPSTEDPGMTIWGRRLFYTAPSLASRHTKRHQRHSDALLLGSHDAVNIDGQLPDGDNPQVPSSDHEDQGASEPSPHEDNTKPGDNESHSQGNNEPIDEPKMGWRAAAVLILISISAVVPASVSLIGSLNGFNTTLSLTPTFTSLIILPIPGNLFNHIVAVVWAWRDKMDVTVNLSKTTAFQTGLTAFSVVIISDWCRGRPSILLFGDLELVAALLVLLIDQTQNRWTDWKSGQITITMYVSIALVAAYLSSNGLPSLTCSV